MDYAKLRAAALDGESEEAVTVDTRALIDKVLARYSGEWTTLRELIQNAADAQATTVRIRWETFPSTSVPLPSTSNRSELLKHTLMNHTLRRLVVVNDGQPFSKTDWARLKRIAEGNPDETKIGAFGVGFYSVFADCEEPFISSGSEAMAFYWKGNALFTKKVQLPEAQRTKDTTFVLDYRNSTTPVPNLLSVSQFLATSLTFVALQSIEFWIDDYKILALRKIASPSTEIGLPRDLETETKEGYMKVVKVEWSSSQIDAVFISAVGWKPQSAASASRHQHESYSTVEIPSLRSFFSKLTSSTTQASARAKVLKEEKAAQEALSEDLTALSTSTIFLRATTATVATKISSSFAQELERATKKPPPKTTKLAILTSSYEEAVFYGSEKPPAASQSADVFATVLPTRKPGGRIFIGFPTMQTTGAGLHISAPSLIPTVEREAIDLNARWVRTWNMEMLRVAGIMTRLAFANEMLDLSELINRASQGNSKVPTAEAIAKFIPAARHIFQSFTFADSTPSAQVGQIIEEAFWTSYRRPVIEVLSTRGVLPTSSVRVFSEELSRFVDGIPVVPKELKDNSFVRKLHDFGLIAEIDGEDVRKELETKALNSDQLAHFIRWAAKKAASGELDPVGRAALLDVVIAELSDGGNSGQIIQLGQIRTYLASNRIPPNLPIPPTTIPFSLTGNCQPAELQALGWEALEFVPWLRFLIETAPSQPDDQNLVKSSDFALKVLTVLSKNWDSQSQATKTSIVNMLKVINVMPTKFGMKKPPEAFFPTVKLFDDLPTLQGCGNIKEKFLVALGVRKTVDLETIFARLLNPSADPSQKRWSHMELIKYLASVKDDIPAEDLKKLRDSRFCPAEAGPKGAEPTKASAQLYKVSELFEPKDSLRLLKLPILQWPGPPGSFRPNSVEAKFLVNLGLRSYPTVPELVDLMASSDKQLREAALSYYTANHQLNGYSAFNIAATTKAFIPIQGDDKYLVPPSGCFTNEQAAVLGYNILRRDLHPHAFRLGVQPDPPIADCINRLLARPPTTNHKAVAFFEYFASRLVDLNDAVVARVRGAPIVPLIKSRGSVSEKHGGTQSITYISPQQCYLGNSSTYGEIFDFVDFGPLANTFLFKCGAQSEPTKAELAARACAEPARLLSILQTPEKYLALLRSLADELSTLKRDKDLYRKMKTAPFLLAFKEMPRTSSKSRSVDDDDDEAPVKHYQLAAPGKIVILDDIISYRLFKDSVICAPEEETLENFYMALGAQPLSAIVQEDLRIGPHSEKQDNAIALRKHVLERSKLFLYEYAKDKPDAIKHDVRWLEKNMSVELVKSISLRRSLKGSTQVHNEKRSAASASTGHGYVLYAISDHRPDMYQVGQAICQLVLHRHNQQSYLYFEPFLKLDLLDLRARGYNVDRVLRAKAAEARIAEDERRRAYDEEQRRIREREAEVAATKASESSRHKKKSSDPVMPGSFVVDDDTRGTGGRKNKGLLGSLSKRFGFDRDDDDDHDIGREPQHQSGPKTNGKRPEDNGRVTSPEVVQQNLRSAVKATRAYNSETLFSPPKTSEVKEQATYCDSTSEKNISFAAEAANGMRVFLARDLSVPPMQFLSAHMAAINTFAGLLVEIGAVYGMPDRSLHVFYDERGNTIAFNSKGSVFCNLRFFIQLHAAKIEGASGTRYGEAKAETAVWWWVVLAHELAHNLVSTHNSDHSYYT